jgi:two-component system sensor histidine kinase CssS
MRESSLFLKVSFKLGVLWVVMFLLFIVGLVSGVNHFFKLETFSTIEKAQEMIGVDENKLENYSIEDNSLGILESSEVQNIRNVQHLVILKKDLENNVVKLDEEISKNLINQEQAISRYTHMSENGKMFYIVRKIKIYNVEAYLFSYMWDTYQRDLSARLVGDGYKVMLILFWATIITALIITRSITKPIKQTERIVKSIMDQKWVNPPKEYLDDEIGRLMEAVFMMQEKLKDRESESRAFLQSISHDLKTPVMVIRSYAQAIKDDMLIENSLNRTVDVIDREAQYLERRVKNLLFLNSLEKLYADREHFKYINAEWFFENLIERFQMNEKAIELRYISNIKWIYGHEEGLETAFSNIIENGLRFAKRSILIETESKESVEVIRILNDGPSIDETIIDSLFDAFYRHKEGHFGLGLYIAKRIFDYHGGNIVAYNKEPWVVFEIELPKFAMTVIEESK